MQGNFIIGAVLVTVLGPSAALAADLPLRQSCAKGEPVQQVQQAPQRQQTSPQQPLRAKRQGCPITRSVPPVVDPTPTFLL
jgi:hypothetical protein